MSLSAIWERDGVAAFSIVCYFFPIIFMVYNAIAQSAQPIISYNFGTGDGNRAQYAFQLCAKTALICGIFLDGVDTTTWFASEGETAFSVWDYVDNYYLQIAIKALCDSVAHRISGTTLNKP